MRGDLQWRCGCGLRSGVVTFHTFDGAKRSLHRHLDAAHEGVPESTVIASANYFATVDRMAQYEDDCSGTMEWPEGSGG